MFSPVLGPEAQSDAPAKFKDAGIIELEKKCSDWDKSLAEVTVDEVIMGNVLQAGQGQNPGPAGDDLCRRSERNARFYR